MNNRTRQLRPPGHDPERPGSGGFGRIQPGVASQGLPGQAEAGNVQKTGFFSCILERKMVKSFQVSKKCIKRLILVVNLDAKAQRMGGHQSQGAKNPEKPISLEGFCGKLAGWM
jgi:hypothetical protein